MAVTGSDTSSNALFGALQVTAAKDAGISSTLLAAANSSGGVLGKMISPQNLAIGAAAVGLAGQEGDLFRKVLGWSLVLVLGDVRPRLSAIDTGSRLDGRLVTAPARMARSRPTLNDWGRSCGVASSAAEHVVTHEHQLATYASDGLLQYAVTPGGVVLPGTAAEVAGGGARLPRGRRRRSSRAAPAPASPAARCRSPTAS